MVQWLRTIAHALKLTVVISLLQPQPEVSAVPLLISIRGFVLHEMLDHQVSTVQTRTPCCSVANTKSHQGKWAA